MRGARDGVRVLDLSPGLQAQTATTKAGVAASGQVYEIYLKDQQSDQYFDLKFDYAGQTYEAQAILATATAAQMRDAVLGALPADIYIGAAAVSDYTPRQVAPQKLKKTADSQSLVIELVRTPDILAEVAAQTQSLKLVVGFAAETHDVEKYARGKLVDKRLDLVIANQVGISGGGFESDNNAATAFWQDGEQVFPATSKRELAEQLLALIARRLQA